MGYSLKFLSHTILVSKVEFCNKEILVIFDIFVLGNDSDSGLPHYPTTDLLGGVLTIHIYVYTVQTRPLKEYLWGLSYLHDGWPTHLPFTKKFCSKNRYVFIRCALFCGYA